MEPLFPWVGVRKVAIVPVIDTTVDPGFPTNFSYQVRTRMFYDPDPTSGEDHSFQNYLQALSYGRAFVEGEVFPPVASNSPEINIPAMNSLPAGHGCTHMVAVLPHSFGAHRGGHAFWDLAPVNGITAWSRVALYQDRFLSMRQQIGVWGMEILHAAVHFGDLYNVQPNLGAYDVMAGAGASSHATAHTKAAMGWLPFGRFAQHSGTSSKHKLQAISLPQPPPTGMATAVSIASRLGNNRFLVEARMRTDQYERSDSFGDGIPQQGVIIYEVADRLSVFLRAQLTPGGRYTNDPEGLTVTVDQAIPGGFTVSIKRTPSAECPRILDEIASLTELLETETDPFTQRQLRQRIAQLKTQARDLGCL